MKKSEQEKAERQIAKTTKKVYKNELSFWLGRAAIGGSYYDRHKPSDNGA